MKLKNPTILECVDIGKWKNYQSYTNKEQIAIQRNNFIYTGLENANGDIPFIFTSNMKEFNDYIESVSALIKTEDTTTIIEDEVYYTTKIEGAKTTRIRTSEIHNGASLKKDNEYSEKMVKNTFAAVKLLNICSSIMTVDTLIKVWNVLIEGVCENESIRGETFRIGPVYAGEHEGASFDSIPQLMNKWISFYNSEKFDNYPFIKASLLHFAFETIHPFCDGNGRMGRLLINNYLISRGIDSAKAVSFSMQIDARRPHYDAAFVDAENLYNDCTPFLEYMLEIMCNAYETALEVQKENIFTKDNE